MIQLNHFRLPRCFFTGPVEVEIGFGKGDFLLELAKKDPQTTFVGIEISGLSVDSIERRARKLDINNVFVIKLDASVALKLFFADESIRRIWINFPDPWHKKRHEKRRITRKENLEVFARKLEVGGAVVLRTDWEPFVKYTLEQAQETGFFSVKVAEDGGKKFDDIDFSALPETKYERRWREMGRRIWIVVLRKTVQLTHTSDTLILKGMPHVLVERISFDPQKLSGKQVRVEHPHGQFVVKFFDVWRKGDDFLVETLLAERSITHYFFLLIRKTEKGYLIKVSPFSEVLKTEAVVDFVNMLARGRIPL